MKNYKDINMTNEMHQNIASEINTFKLAKILKDSCLELTTHDG